MRKAWWLAIAVVAGCGITDPDDEYELVPGAIQDDPEDRNDIVVHVSEDGTAHVSFHTYGQPCVKPHRTDVLMSLDTVILTPYDRLPRYEICEDIQTRIPHAASFEMGSLSTVLIALHGRDTQGRLVRIEQPFTR